MAFGARIATQRVRGAGVTIARITTPGLTAMAASVALLWGCLIGERVILQRAVTERNQVLREMRVLRERQRAEPTTDPVPLLPHHSRTARG